MQNTLDEKHIKLKHIGLKSHWMKNTLDKKHIG